MINWKGLTSFLVILLKSIFLCCDLIDGFYDLPVWVVSQISWTLIPTLVKKTMHIFLVMPCNVWLAAGLQHSLYSVLCNIMHTNFTFHYSYAGFHSISSHLHVIDTKSNFQSKTYSGLKWSAVELYIIEWNKNVVNLHTEGAQNLIQIDCIENFADAEPND